MRRTQWAWRVALVRARNPLNIGAAARAMANFGLEDLVVVAPYAPTWREARSAVGAEQVMQSARAVEDLTEAIGDCQLVIGTTTGVRRRLDRELIPLADFTRQLKRRSGRGRAALLFGSEKTGLSNEDLSICHAWVRIPTAAHCPSMNLGQAVAVCAYELVRSGLCDPGAPRPAARPSSPANAQTLEHLLERATRVLEASSYFTPKTRRAQIVKLRRVALDLGLTQHDARILGAALAQIEWKIGTAGN
jgi:tRNA/rRNA methyltransferase